MWPPTVPDGWEVADAECYAVLQAVRAAFQQSGDPTECRLLVMVDNQGVLRQVESAWRAGMPEGLRKRQRGAMLEEITCRE